MIFPENLAAIVDEIVKSRWEITEGRVIPETENIGLGNKAVRLDVTMLYADLADSTEMAMYDAEIAAKVYKAFLTSCLKIIIYRGGKIRSFDGDRVMGVFVGDSKNTNAVKAALNINYAFTGYIVPKFKDYGVFREGTLKLAHCVGIDTSSVLVVRAGIRKNNDLVWVGRAANIAAKLSTLREAPYYSYITKAVYSSLDLDVRVGRDGSQMWESRSWNALPLDIQTIYRSACRWMP